MKYFTYRQLSKYTRTVDPDATVKCPVLRHYLHNDKEIRCVVALSDTAHIEIEVPIADFNALDSVPGRPKIEIRR